MTTLIPTNEANNERKGYPSGLKEISFGQMNMPEILEGAQTANVVKYEKTGHNEITMTMKYGMKICRLRETNIVFLHMNGKSFLLNTGGWATKSTKTHMVDFLKRNLPPEIKVGVYKEGGIMKMRVDFPGGRLLGSFDQQIVAIHTESGYTISSDKSE